MLNIIKDLARNIERKWREEDLNYQVFADIAKKEMDSVDIVSNFKFDDINRFLNITEIKNIQIFSEFSDLHMKLYDNGKFYIEVLNWWNRDTSIHDHGFTGVLLQLQGSALNVIYSFEEETTISQDIAFGNVKLSDAYISYKGDCRIIPYGRKEKHAVLHLEKPTISLIVRTHPIVELSPQLNYFPPYVMANHSSIDLSFNKKIKYFKLLSKIDNDLCKKELIDELNASTITEQFWFIMKLSAFTFNQNNIDMLREYVNCSSNEFEKNIRNKIISIVALRKASQYIIDHVKTRFKTYEDRLFISCLAFSFNKKEREFLFDKLGLEYYESKITYILSKLPEDIGNELKMNLNILSLGEG